MDDRFNWIPKPDMDPEEFEALRAKFEAEAAAEAEAGQKPQSDERPSEPGQWPAPLDFLAAGSTEPPILRADHIPPALWPFVIDTAERMGVDPACVALGSIIAAGSALTDDWQVQPKRFDYTWKESPRLWGVILGDPSVLKSPVIAACTAPIDRMEAAARADHEKAMLEHKQLAKPAKGEPEAVRPRLPRYLAESATLEALSEILRADADAKMVAPAKKILVRQDELGEFLANLDRYNAGGRGGGDRGAYLRLYNGGPHTIDRIGRGPLRLPNWSACFLGGCQPEPIQRIAKNAADDGLLQRFLYAVPGEQRPGLDRTPDRNALARYTALFPTLTALSPPRHPDRDRPQHVVIHRDGHAHREAVDQAARALAAMPDTSKRLMAALGKVPGWFARIALTFHLIDIADARAQQTAAPELLIISPATAKRAESYLLEVLLPHLLRAEAVMFETAQSGHARWIAGLILARGFQRITTRDIVRAYRDLRAPEMARVLAETMESLVAIGWLEPEEPANRAKPVHAWQVNPAVHERFAAHAQQERQRREAAREAVAATVAARVSRK